MRRRAISALTTELEELRKPLRRSLDNAIAVVPMESLRLARAQFDISRRLCQQGRRGLAGHERDRRLARSTRR